MRNFCVPLLAATIVAGAQAQELLPPLPELKFAEVRARDQFLGDRWSYMEAGPIDAPAVVLLHGIGGNSTVGWRFSYSALAKRMRVIGWNAPGYMLSDGLRVEKPTCSDWANALADFLDALTLAQVDIVGNSFGSVVARCFAMHHPARVRKIVLTGTFVWPLEYTPQQRAAAIAAREEQIASGGYGFGARAAALLARGSAPALIESLRNGVRATNPRAFMQAAHVIYDTANPHYTEVAAKVTAPVLIVQGAEDLVAPVEGARRLQQALPNARLEILEGVGHLPELEAPGRVNRLIADFLAP